MKSVLEYAVTVTDKETIDIDHLSPQMLSGVSLGAPQSSTAAVNAVETSGSP